jgi:hypothetical protein
MRLLAVLGIGRKYAPIPDLSGREFDPLDPVIRHFGSKPVLCTMDLTRLRCLQPLAFRCDKGGHHPYVLSIADFLASRSESYAGSALEYFYELWRPANAAELLGLTERRGPLSEMSPEIRVWPWDDSDVETLERNHRDYLESLKGRPYPGRQFHGPKSAAEGSSHYERVIHVAKMIRRWGYWRTNGKTGDIDGLIMSRGRDWAFFVLGGQHRSPALAALGHRRARVRVFNPGVPVDRDQISTWPNVRNGLFTAGEATQLFDRIFEARQPANFPSSLWSSFAASRMAAGDSS